MDTELYISPQLMEAVKEGDAEKVKQLLDNGAKPNTVDIGGLNPENPHAMQMAAVNPTALMVAAGKGHAEVVKLLLSAGANLNHQAKSSCGFSSFTSGYTALMMAADEGYAEIVKLLLSAGADVNVANGEGETALDVAIAMKAVPVVDLGAASDAVLEARGYTPEEIKRQKQKRAARAEKNYSESILLLKEAMEKK